MSAAVLFDSSETTRLNEVVIIFLNELLILIVFDSGSRNQLRVDVHLFTTAADVQINQGRIFLIFHAFDFKALIILLRVDIDADGALRDNRMNHILKLS